MQNVNEPNTQSGLSGSFKFAVASAVVMLGIVGILFVFDVIPRALLGDFAVRAVLSLGILLVVGAVIAMLARSK